MVQRFPDFEIISNYMDSFLEDLIDKNFEIYVDQSRKNDTKESKNKAYFIYLHSLFERYRVKLRAEANINSRRAEKIFFKELMDYATKRRDEKKDSSLYNSLVDLDRNKEEITKHLYKLDNILRIERLAYGFTPGSKLYNNTEEIFDSFIVSREIRNLMPIEMIRLTTSL